MTDQTIRKLGVIGGMGPAATAEFFRRLVMMTDAADDQDHVPTVIISDPRIPDRTSYLRGIETTPFAPVLNKEAKTLVSLGCSILAMPCNTAHACIDEIAEGISDAEFINMPFETVKLAADLGFKNIGLLATRGTVEAGVYHRYGDMLGVEVTLPSEPVQDAVMAEIYQSVKAGKEGDQTCLFAAEEELSGRGCDCLVLACTELSVLANGAQGRNKLTWFDALDVLAWKSVLASGIPAFDLLGRYQHA